MAARALQDRSPESVSVPADRESDMLILTFLRAAYRIAVDAMALRRALRRRYRVTEE